MRLRHSLPPVALGAMALGAALGASPAHADTPSPARLELAKVATSPGVIEVSVADVVTVRLTAPLPLPTAVAPLPLPSTEPLPLPRPSTDPLPLPHPSTNPLPLPSSVPVPTPSPRPPTVAPSRSAPMPQATPAPSTSGSPAARVASPPSLAPAMPVPATASPRDAHGTSAGRAPDQARAAMTASTEQRPNPPARPRPGPPAFVLALVSAPTGVGAGGVDTPTSTADVPPPASPLHPGRTVTAVDRRAVSRPVERGPPPPRQLLITHPRPRR
jgi:hypothetical protein